MTLCFTRVKFYSYVSAEFFALAFFRKYIFKIVPGGAYSGSGEWRRFIRAICQVLGDHHAVK
jgi:hypothetical protein